MKVRSKITGFEYELSEFIDNLGYELIEGEKEKPTRRGILSAARKCVCGDREQDHGSPESNFALIASFWTEYMKVRCASVGADICITPEDVANMMALLKIARIATGRFKEDSYIDACGYLACAAECAGGSQ